MKVSVSFIITAIIILFACSCSAVESEDNLLKKGNTAPLTVRLKVKILDASTNMPVSARVRLRGEDGTYYRPENSLKAGKKDLWLHYERSAGKEILFFSPPEFGIELAPGTYNLLVERGFEYFPWKSDIELTADHDRTINVELSRWINMPELGWMSGDYHVHFARSLPGKTEKILELLKAADLKVVHLLMSQKNGIMNNIQPAFGEKGSAYAGEYSLHAGEEYTNDDYGHMAFVDIPRLIEPVGTGERGQFSKADYPTNFDMAKKAKDLGGTVIACHGGHGEFPVDLAFGVIDGVEILQGNKWQMRYKNEELFTPHWYHALNCGFKITGTAASDYPVLRDKILGQLSNYVYVGNDFTPEAWLEGLKKGKSFVTNAPMVLDFTINGMMMGETINLRKAGEKVTLSTQVRSLYPLSHLEILRNGVIVKKISNPSKTLTLDFKEEIPIYRSSWIAVRAKGNHPNELRGQLYIHSNPIYITVNKKRILVPESAVWWIDRIDELILWTDTKAVFDHPEDKERTLKLFYKGKKYYEILARQK